MEKDTFKRGLCSVLCAAMLAQPMTAAAWWEEDPAAPEESYTWEEESAVPERSGEWGDDFAAPEDPCSIEAAEMSDDVIELHAGEVIIPAGVGAVIVNQLLSDALAGDGNTYEWEYYCKGQTPIGTWGNESWGSISGFETKTGSFIKTTYSHPALADNSDGSYQVRIAGTTAEVTLSKLSEARKADPSIELNQNVTVTMPLNSDGSINYADLEQAIFVGVYAGGTPNLTASEVSITYYAEETYLGSKYSGYVSLIGGKISNNLSIKRDADAISEGVHEIKFTYAGDDTYNGAEATASVTLERQTVPQGAINLKEGPWEVPVVYTVEGGIDYAATEQAILAAVVDNTDPAGVAVTVEYNAAKSGEAWKPLDYAPSGLNALGQNAFGTGVQNIRLSFSGTDAYSAAEQVASVEMKALPEAEIAFTAVKAKLVYTQNEDGSITADVAALESAIRAMFTSDADLSNATLEYYATAKTGSLGDLGKNWTSLTGGKVNGLDYPAISEGEWQVRLTLPAGQTCAKTTVEGTVTVTGREAISHTLNEGPYEVGMKFNAEQGYNYDETIKAIYDAVVAATDPAVGYEAVKMEYTTQADTLGVNFQPLDHQGATGLLNFREGTWKIRITWPETVDYRAASVTVEVTVTDGRLASEVALKEGVSFTYNMAPAVMEQTIFDQVIDWENSTLPEGLDISSFEIRYKAQVDILDGSMDASDLGSLIGKIPGLENVGGSIGDIAGSLGENTKQWMPVGGGKSALGVAYAPMGAGQQQVQVTFKGSEEYKPSEAAEAEVTVNKASVKVKVRSTNVRIGDALPENFITADPADKFDFYTIYAGATSNVSLGIYIDLPDKYDNNKLTGLVDPVVEKISGRSLTKMIQDGVTLGELRSLFAAEELLNLLETLGVDTGSFGQIIKIINAMPSITDGVRIGFGTPGRAGLYSVTVVTDNKNYKTGVGMGTLLVRMRLQGVKLTWNQDLPKKISAAEAKEFDFGVTLSYNGDVTIDQGSVHYLYSGLTSKWKVYSSTTTPPMEPGNYVMTVVTLGGNYQAAPITRSFQITK